MKAKFIRKADSNAKQYYQTHSGITKTITGRYFASSGNTCIDELIGGYEIQSIICIKEDTFTREHNTLIGYSLAEALYNDQAAIIVGDSTSYHIPGKGSVTTSKYECKDIEDIANNQEL